MSGTKSVVLRGVLKGESGRDQISEIKSDVKDREFDRIEIDLSKVDDIDFDTLAALLTVKNEIRDFGTTVELMNIPTRIERILELFRVQSATTD